jgi:hypothetical protein
MKTITLYEMAYRVRESHDLSSCELDEVARLLTEFSSADRHASEGLIIAFLKILLPELTKAELSSDSKTAATLFQKTYQQFLAKRP